LLSPVFVQPASRIAAIISPDLAKGLELLTHKNNCCDLYKHNDMVITDERYVLFANETYVSV